MDRDAKFNRSFRVTLQQVGVKSVVVVLPPRSPKLNSQLERFFGSLRTACLDRMIFFGEDALRRAAGSYLDHFHQARNHQGLGRRCKSSATVR